MNKQNSNESGPWAEGDRVKILDHTGVPQGIRGLVGTVHRVEESSVEVLVNGHQPRTGYFWVGRSDLELLNHKPAVMVSRDLQAVPNEVEAAEMNLSLLDAANARGAIADALEASQTTEAVEASMADAIRHLTEATERLRRVRASYMSHRCKNAQTTYRVECKSCRAGYTVTDKKRGRDLRIPPCLYCGATDIDVTVLS